MYTNERNIQILISLLKQYGIKKIIASPGTTNMSFVGSVQNDSWFEVYSSVDERSAAYMAVGLAEESDEPVVITCTEATASRNYMSALTEAFYRKIPVLAVTGYHGQSLVGHHVPQVIDRSVLPNDIACCSVELRTIQSAADENDCISKCNKALSALTHKGGGPVHINLVTTFSRDFSVGTLPPVRKITRHQIWDSMPTMNSFKRIAIFIGSHHRFDDDTTKQIEDFCERNNAVVFCDHTSNYYGKYKINFSIAASQAQINKNRYAADCMISIGEISGAECYIPSKEVWRISEDGIMRDTRANLTRVFEMRPLDFFGHYNSQEVSCDMTGEYYTTCVNIRDGIYEKMPELPFSNIWIAKNLSKRIPEGANIQFAIFNSLRSWDFFDLPSGVTSNCNVGGFGIDGAMSTIIGASLCNKDKLYFGVIGDLAYFYDMNALGNRHIGNNVRIMLINNGRGVEFRNYSHPAVVFGDKADDFIAAAGHYGNKSSMLVKHYAEDLGYEYMTASDKETFMTQIEFFVSAEKKDKPVIFEIFVDYDDDRNALKLVRDIEQDKSYMMAQSGKARIKKMLGDDNIRRIKDIIRK
ncbi:thiamine pyrophosphate-binding protein [Ruminococcus sp. 5_1_39BFAA]|uniref:thiamine pyrophosphate-binding protein n=1 Tax=Ruminococcus sp. 5_1_39BFAA TaxID=457412 RepID=UPI0035669A55